MPLSSVSCSWFLFSRNHSLEILMQNCSLRLILVCTYMLHEQANVVLNHAAEYQVRCRLLFFISLLLFTYKSPIQAPQYNYFAECKKYNEFPSSLIVPIPGTKVGIAKKEQIQKYTKQRCEIFILHKSLTQNFQLLNAGVQGHAVA
jgi:hypothetical protein